MLRSVTAAALAAAVVGLAPEATAGELAIGLEGGYFEMTNARNSATAVFGGSAGGPTFGGLVRYRLGNHIFVGVGGRYFQREGQRAFVADASSRPFRLGHPLTVRQVPVYGFVGFRFLPRSRLAPYVAAGGGVTSVHEKSVVGGLEESFSSTHGSFHALGGLEYGRGALRVGAELSYSSVPDALGLGGVSKVYGETDAGGLTFLGRIVVVP